jgi:hypothetical protein
LENQRVRWNPVNTDEGNCIGVKSVFLRDCSDSTADCFGETGEDISCDITGPQIESDNITHEPNICFRETFSILDNECKDAISFQEKFAYRMLTAKNKLRLKLNQKIAATILANAQENQYNHTYGEIAGVETYFDSADMTADIIAEFAITADNNDIYNPVILSGGALYHAAFNANYNQFNDDQRDQIQKMNHFEDWYWDTKYLRGITGQDSIIMYDAGSFGFFSSWQFKNRNPENKQDANNTFVYSEPDETMMFMNDGQPNDIMYDVTLQHKCDTVQVNGSPQRRWGTYVEVTMKGGIVKGAEDCDGNSGVLEFVVGEAPSGT